MGRKGTESVVPLGFVGVGAKEGPEAELLARMISPMNAPVDSVRIEEPDPAGIGIEFTKARLWVVLGEELARSLFPESISDPVRGRFHEIGGTKVLVTESLQALLNTPSLKRAAWEDLKSVMRELGW